MLVLSRDIGEEIFIGDDVIVKILNIDFERKCVRVGIEAPKEISIVRRELKERQTDNDK